MTERADDLAKLISLENGKALVDAKGEVTYAAEFFRWYAEEAVRADGTVATAPSGANRILVVRQPVGVCVLVTPWNFPAAMATRKIGPALAAGCTVVLKPASDTPLTALAMAGILAEAGVPEGVVNVVTGFGDAGAALVNHDDVNKVSFTGSTEVGKEIVRGAAGNLKKLTLELGGKSPNVVYSDANMEEAIPGAANAIFFNHGQCCAAGSRLFVEHEHYDEVLETLRS